MSFVRAGEAGDSLEGFLPGIHVRAMRVLGTGVSAEHQHTSEHRWIRRSCQCVVFWH